MAIVELIYDVKPISYIAANTTKVLSNGEPIYYTNGQYSFGDGTTQLSSLPLYGGTGGGTWGSITGTLSSQTDLQTALNGKQNTITTGTTAQYLRGDLSLATFPTNVSSFTNDSGYITSSALSPYLTSVTAASTYLTIANAASTYQTLLGFTAENLANKATSFATLNNTLYPTTQAVSNYVTGLGYITSSALTPYLTIASAASTYQPIGSYLTGNQTITVSGDASGSGATSIALTLATVNSNVGTFNNVTVNAKGLVTAASNVSYLTGLTVGTTTIGSGTNTRILYNNAGVLGEYLVTGTGTTAVLSTSPTFTTSILTPNVTGINGALTFTNAVQSSGSVTSFTFTKPNNTGQTASTNIQGFLFTTGSRQWATGAVTTQEEVRITAPTYSFVGASTITNAYTLFVNAPIAGTNATITNNFAAGFSGNVNVIGSLYSTGFRLVDGNQGLNKALISDANGNASWQTLGGGYTKSINNISTNTSAGSAANTEYYYICTASLTLTLPTAVGNTNEYNIKVTSGTLTINTTSSQTIDGSTSITMSVANTARTLISDGSNWQIF